MNLADAWPCRSLFPRPLFSCPCKVPTHTDAAVSVWQPQASPMPCRWRSLLPPSLLSGHRAGKWAKSSLFQSPHPGSISPVGGQVLLGENWFLDQLCFGSRRAKQAAMPQGLWEPGLCSRSLRNSERGDSKQLSYRYWLKSISQDRCSEDHTLRDTAPGFPILYKVTFPVPILTAHLMNYRVDDAEFLPGRQPSF